MSGKERKGLLTVRLQQDSKEAVINVGVRESGMMSIDERYDEEVIASREIEQ